MTTYEEKELQKFSTNPTYRQKVISKIHKEQDAKYQKNIKSLELEVSKLAKARTTEIARIANARWATVLTGKLAINQTEGKVKIHQRDVLFSSIKGAELNIQQGARIVTTDNTRAKKSASLGGAVVGYAVGGTFGAVAGGVGLGKTKTTGKIVSNQIPTCSHIGVLINIDGFVSEVSLLDTQVDQSSSAFQQAYQMAQKIVARLAVLAQTPVPSRFLLPEQEQSVLQIEAQIPIKKKELEDTVAEKPTYALPATYRSPEQSAMSDPEYLAYLEQQDVVRQEEIIRDRELLKQQNAQRLEMEREAQAKRQVEKIAADKIHQEQMAQDSARFQQQIAQLQGQKKIECGEQPGKKAAWDKKRVLSILVDIVFWYLSLCMLLAGIAFILNISVLGGIVFLLSALLINPLIYRLIQRKVFPMKRWMCIVIFLVGAIVGAMTQ